MRRQKSPRARSPPRVAKSEYNGGAYLHHLLQKQPSLVALVLYIVHSGSTRDVYELVHISRGKTKMTVRIAFRGDMHVTVVRHNTSAQSTTSPLMDSFRYLQRFRSASCTRADVDAAFNFVHGMLPCTEDELTQYSWYLNCSSLVSLTGSRRTASPLGRSRSRA